ncbi:MAG TPA: hypothetical protein VFM88_13610 [Vicinamibacteria bacterium]|nr:hypothetical protein [Vicinamibacteria bacterium]
MSGHLSEEDLVLHHYGEPGREDAAAHLEACAECCARRDALDRDLLAVVDEAPEPGERYGAELWARLEPRLDAPRVAAFQPRRLLLPAALAASLVLAFLLGRHTQSPPGPSPGPSARAAHRERVLMGAVEDHLERSRRVLVELAGAPTQGAAVNISAERAWAANLVANSRIYRQSAARAGEARLADVLDELERLLVEIANGPAEMGPEDVRELRERIEDRGLLFKVKALQSQVRERAQKRDRPRTVS